MLPPVKVCWVPVEQRNDELQKKCQEPNWMLSDGHDLDIILLPVSFPTKSPRTYLNHGG